MSHESVKPAFHPIYGGLKLRPAVRTFLGQLRSIPRQFRAQICEGPRPVFFFEIRPRGAEHKTAEMLQSRVDRRYPFFVYIRDHRESSRCEGRGNIICEFGGDFGLVKVTQAACQTTRHSADAEAHRPSEKSDKRADSRTADRMERDLLSGLLHLYAAVDIFPDHRLSMETDASLIGQLFKCLTRFPSARFVADDNSQHFLHFVCSRAFSNQLFRFLLLEGGANSCAIDRFVFQKLRGQRV